MLDFELTAWLALALLAAVPGLVLGLAPGPPSRSGRKALVATVPTALAVCGFLFVTSQITIAALFDRPDFSAIMQQAFPEDFFHGALRLPIDFAIFCGVIPLAYAATRIIGLPPWFALLALPLTIALAYLALSYRDALHHEAAPPGLRMAIEGATAVAALLIWVAYFLLMQKVARVLRPDLPRR